MSTATGGTSTTLVRRIIGQERFVYAVSLVGWTVFLVAPVIAGLLLKVVLDRLQVEGAAAVAWGAIAALAALEIGRWTLLVGAVWQWQGMWVHWHTVPRLNMLASLVGAPGPAAGRLPGSAGEAVSRFRDDPKHVALIADVWLDVTATCIAAGTAIVIILAIDVTTALVVLVPVGVALLLTRALASRLKALRLAERTATSSVTGFIGDTFGAITAVKAAGAERAVAGRFAALGTARASAALADEVALQMLQTLTGVTSTLCTGLAVLLLAPALADGRASVGDVGLFTSAALVVATLPRWVARLGAYRRQGEVSVTRMARLLPPGADPLELGGRVQTTLRGGPGPFAPTPTEPPDRAPEDRLRSLEVRGLVVDHGQGAVVGPVDLTVRAGTMTVITGPVGSGKSSVLRALLGLVARDAGEIRWNGIPVAEPSSALLPPRVAYLPQVPRLFSESLRETILLGVRDDHLLEALRTACLEPDLAALPEGLQTHVGPRGVRLSGGQVQRAAAARAFARQPDLLVIDDLSSALDATTEALMWSRLVEHHPRPALLVVTHSPAVIARADAVIRLSAPGETTR